MENGTIVRYPASRLGVGGFSTQEVNCTSEGSNYDFDEAYNGGNSLAF